LRVAFDSLKSIIEKMNAIEKAKAVFVTNIAGKEVDWDMIFQFNLDNEDPFYVQIKGQEASIILGIANNPDIVMSGDPEAIVKISQGKGDFTHAISRERISVEKGKVIDVIRLTRAITIVLRTD
jgi:putative sterol carrier protein